MSPRARLWVLLAVSVTAGLVLHAAGRGPLRPPPATSWGAAEEWYEQAGPATAAVAFVRLVAITASAWLAMAVALQLLASLDRGRAMWRAADAVSPRFLRAVARSAAGLSVTAGIALPGVPLAAGQEPPPGTAVMVPLDVEASTSTTTEAATTTTIQPTTSQPTTTTETTSPRTSVPAPTTSPAPTRSPAPPAATGRPARVPADEIEVQPGDSFWSIAAEETGGHDVAGYWLELIEVNRAVLVDPSNVDLLYPGQVLRLP